MVTVRIPTPLRTLTGGEEQVQASGATLREVIDALEQKHPGIKDRLLDDKGVRRFVNIYVATKTRASSTGSRRSSRAAPRSASCPPSPEARERGRSLHSPAPAA